MLSPNLSFERAVRLMGWRWFLSLWCIGLIPPDISSGIDHHQSCPCLGCYSEFFHVSLMILVDCCSCQTMNNYYYSMFSSTLIRHHFWHCSTIHCFSHHLSRFSDWGILNYMLLRFECCSLKDLFLELVAFQDYIIISTSLSIL